MKQNTLLVVGFLNLILGILILGLSLLPMIHTPPAWAFRNSFKDPKKALMLQHLYSQEELQRQVSLARMFFFTPSQP